MTLDELLSVEDIEDVAAWRGDVSAGVADLSAGFEARLSELEEKLAEAEKKYQETAARNYELIQAATAPVDNESDAEVDEEEAAADAVDALFKEDED